MAYIDRRPRMLNTAAKSRKLHGHVSCIGSQPLLGVSTIAGSQPCQGFLILHGLSPGQGFLILQGLSPCHWFLILQDLSPCQGLIILGLRVSALVRVLLCWVSGSQSLLGFSAQFCIVTKLLLAKHHCRLPRHLRLPLSGIPEWFSTATYDRRSKQV